MNIKNKLRIGTGATVSLLVIFIAVIFFYLSIVSRAADQLQTAEKITEQSFQSLLLREQYEANPTENIKSRWNALYEARMTLFRESAALFNTEPVKSLFSQLRASAENGKTYFNQLVENTKKGSSATVMNDLNAQMSNRAQDRTMLALHLVDASRDIATQASQGLILAVIIFASIFFGISIVSYFAKQKVVRAISLLNKGTNIIAAGNLNYRLNIASSDELGQLADSFNAMTEKIKNYYIELEREVHERTRDLQKSNAFLDAIIENIPNMIFLKDAKELRFIRFNKAGESLLGYARKDMIGKNDYDFFPKEQADIFVAKDRETLASTDILDIPEEPIDTKEKGQRWLHTSKIPIYDAKGEPAYLLGISEDITERRQAEIAKSEFVSLASHQLRTPLTEIRWALSSIARSSSLDDEQKQTIEAAHTAVVNMSEIIIAMLSIAHIESGNTKLTISDVPLQIMLQDTIKLFEAMSQRHGVSVEVQCPASLQMHTDEQFLKEIIGNLLDNAYKYTPRGGKVVISAEQHGKELEICISDTGFGIPAEEQDHIFQKFFRATNIKKMKGTGSGLGLYLVYSLVRLLQGNISFTSKENLGTTFVLTFPSTIV